MWIPCFIDINSLVPVKYIINEHRWGKDAVIATYSQYGKGGVFPNGQIQRPWRIPSRTWWEVQDMNNIQGRKHHESLSLKRCIINFNVRATTGITVEQWRSGLWGRFRAACRKEKYNWQWLQSRQAKKRFHGCLQVYYQGAEWKCKDKHTIPSRCGYSKPTIRTPRCVRALCCPVSSRAEGAGTGFSLFCDMNHAPYWAVLAAGEEARGMRYAVCHLVTQQTGTCTVCCTDYIYLISQQWEGDQPYDTLGTSNVLHWHLLSKIILLLIPVKSYCSLLNAVKPEISNSTKNTEVTYISLA